MALSFYSFNAGATPASPADELKRAVLQAMDEGRYADARDDWLRLWELEKSRTAACNIGELSLRIADMPRAAEFLTICVQSTPKDQPNFADRARDEGSVLSLARARQAVGALTLRAPDGAEITLDDRPLGKAPIDREVFVAPGAHHLRAELDNKTGEVAVEVAAGVARRVTIPLVSPPKAAAVPPVPAPVRTPTNAAAVQPAPGVEEKRPQGWIVMTGLVASSSLLAAGTGLLIVSSTQSEDRHDVVSKNACFFDYSNCTSTRDSAHAVDMYQVVGTGALLAGAALAGSTLAYALLPRNNGPKVGVRGTGVVVETTW